MTLHSFFEQKKKIDFDLETHCFFDTPKAHQGIKQFLAEHDFDEDLEEHTYTRALEGKTAVALLDTRASYFNRSLEFFYPQYKKPLLVYTEVPSGINPCTLYEAYQAYHYSNQKMPFSPSFLSATATLLAGLWGGLFVGMVAGAFAMPMIMIDIAVQQEVMDRETFQGLSFSVDGAAVAAIERLGNTGGINGS